MLVFETRTFAATTADGKATYFVTRLYSGVELFTACRVSDTNGPNAVEPLMTAGSFEACVRACQDRAAIIDEGETHAA